MAKLNTRPDGAPKVYTHEGAEAYPHLKPIQQLRRSVASCLLWEDEHYEDGVSIAERISSLAQKVSAKELAALAIEAREQFNLRHVSLLLLDALTISGKGDSLTAETFERVIQRADELAEFLAIYWRKGRHPLSAQAKKGLARAFGKFNEYALAKYDRDGKVKLRDVLRMVRPKPADEARSALYKRVKDRELATPDTWEVELSAGKDKKETFERLIAEKKLGYLALIRNLRKMSEVGVNPDTVKRAILAREGGAHRVLPFRFIAAAREASHFERELDQAMVANFSQLPKLPGKTVIVLDVSGSMQAGLSGRSTMTRVDAGAALAAVASFQCENAVVYATAGNDGTRVHQTARIPPRVGMALRDALVASMRVLGGGGIFLKPMMDYIQKEEGGADRIIVITDEQDCAVADKDKPSLAAPFGTKGNYLINVASAKNGIGYGKWTHIDGFSESALRFIAEYEKGEA